jgi:DNA adenine methylase
LPPCEPCLPLLKWPGGKRWAASEIAELVRCALAPTGRYIEPFLGGGAVFFFLRPKRALLGDINPQLIETYQTVRDTPKQVLDSLRSLRVDRETFYQLRASRPATAVERAVRFLYLNRTAFGGIYRLNAAGEFNVPYGGRSHAVLWTRAIIDRAADALQGAELQCADFQQLLRRARAGDVVYCDPTYTVAHDNNGFVRYNERNFSWSDQNRLADAAAVASGRGATVVVSNAHHVSVRALYREATATVLHRRSSVSRVISGRREVSEYLFILGPDGSRRPSRRVSATRR